MLVLSLIIITTLRVPNRRTEPDEGTGGQRHGHSRSTEGGGGAS